MFLELAHLIKFPSTLLHARFNSAVNCRTKIDPWLHKSVRAARDERRRGQRRRVRWIRLPARCQRVTRPQSDRKSLIVSLLALSYDDEIKTFSRFIGACRGRQGCRRPSRRYTARRRWRTSTGDPKLLRRRIEYKKVAYKCFYDVIY